MTRIEKIETRARVRLYTYHRSKFCFPVLFSYFSRSLLGNLLISPSFSNPAIRFSSLLSLMGPAAGIVSAVLMTNQGFPPSLLSSQPSTFPTIANGLSSSITRSCRLFHFFFGALCIPTVGFHVTMSLRILWREREEGLGIHPDPIKAFLFLSSFAVAMMAEDLASFVTSARPSILSPFRPCRASFITQLDSLQQSQPVRIFTDLADITIPRIWSPLSIFITAFNSADFGLLPCCVARDVRLSNLCDEFVFY